MFSMLLRRSRYISDGSNWAYPFSKMSGVNLLTDRDITVERRASACIITG